MLFRNSKIALFDMHFERITNSCKALKIEININKNDILEQIQALVVANKLLISKVKWQIFEDEFKKVHYTLECSSIDAEINEWNEIGWHVGILKFEHKEAFKLNNMKRIRPDFYSFTNNEVKSQKLDDLILTVGNEVIESSIGNIFIIKGEEINTPPLISGCVAGVMRQFVLNFLKSGNYFVKEKEMFIEDILHADELFITNAIRGIKWVERMENKRFHSILTQRIFNSIGKILYN